MKAHDMEMIIASFHGKSSSSSDSKKVKGEFKKNPKSSNPSNKDSVVVSTGELVQISRNPSMKTRKVDSSRILKRSVLC